MKIGGVELKGPSEEVLVLPRPTADDIVFRAVAVTNSEEFEKMVPAPKPKGMMVAGGEWKERLDDPDYVKALSDYTELRFAYMVLKSLAPSNIEWEKVIEDQPSTWGNWSNELIESGLSQTELNRVIACVSSANCLDEKKLEAARESFLRGLAKASEKSSGPDTEPQTTPSGEAAKG